MDGETYSPHHARHYTAYGDGSDRPATRRRVLQAGAAAAALGLAGCASLRNRPTDDTIPLDDEHDSEDHGGGTPRAVQAGSGAVHVVGSAPTDHDTIQAAFDAAAPGDLVNVTQSYDPSGETWPVVSKKVLTVEADGQLPGSDGIVFDTDNRRPPGPVLRDVPITGGARGIVFRGTDFPNPYRCLVRGCSGVACAFEDTFEADGGTYRSSTNSVELYGCTSVRAGEAGLKTDYQTHSIVLDNSRTLHSGGFGAYFDDPANCVVRAGQYEDNAKAGLFARAAESVSMRDTYVEENGKGRGSFSADIVVRNGQETLVERCYVNGLGTPYPVRFLGNAGSESPTVRNCRFETHARSNVWTEVEDTDVDRVSGNVDPDSPATRIRNYGTIVGPTGEGVNLGRVRGRDPGDRALSEGTPGVEDGTFAVWMDSGVWRPSRGRDVVPDADWRGPQTALSPLRSTEGYDAADRLRLSALWLRLRGPKRAPGPPPRQSPEERDHRRLPRRRR